MVCSIKNKLGLDIIHNTHDQYSVYKIYNLILYSAPAILVGYTADPLPVMYAPYEQISQELLLMYDSISINNLNLSLRVQLSVENHMGNVQNLKTMYA